MTKEEPKIDKQKSVEPPAPEVLKPQSGDHTGKDDKVKDTLDRSKMVAKLRRGSYKPSHKATFIGLAIVLVVLVVVGGGITYFMIQQDGLTDDSTQQEVTINTDTLNKLGVSRNPVDNLGTELVIGPSSTFRNSVTINGDTSIAGQLNLNGSLSASSVNFSDMKAGEAVLTNLNVNGDGTMTNLNLRKDLEVAGSTRLQGTVTILQLLTINNNVNVLGNLSVGGALSTRYIQASSLTSDTTLTIGGHIITRGNAPSVSKGSGLSYVDTVSISGNDTAGTVAVNVGTGSRNGVLANISFVNNFGTTPHVVVTAVGSGVSDLYINRNASGFSIGVSSISSGGHAFDYIVMQ